MKKFLGLKYDNGQKPKQFNNRFGSTATGSSQDTEKMHHGYAPYRRKSKHLIDLENDDNTPLPPFYVPLDDLNSPSPSLQEKNAVKGKGKLTQNSSADYSYSDLSVLSNSSKRKNKVKKAKKANTNRPPREIQFHPEDEVKEYLVQPESYKLGLKDPFGLDILAHVDQLWLEHTVHSIGSLPGFYYQYNVFDESEQRILFLRPNFDYVEDYMEGTDKAPCVPTSFRLFTAIGLDICRINFKTNFCCTKTQMLVEVNRRGRAIGFITLISDCFDVTDTQGRQVMKFNIVGSTDEPKFRCCFSTKKHLKVKKYLVPPGEELKCNIYVSEDYQVDAEKKPISPPYGTISQNGPDPEKVVRGEPYGFYFFIENDKGVQRSPAKNLYKLFSLATLLTLTVHYKHELRLKEKPEPPSNSLPDGEDTLSSSVMEPNT